MQVFCQHSLVSRFCQFIANIHNFAIPSNRTILLTFAISCLKSSELQGIRKFGKNFSVIASILGTKTESHVRSFFVNYRRRYDLDQIYKVIVGSIDHIEHGQLSQEYEAEFGPSDQSEGGEKEEPEVIFFAFTPLNCSVCAFVDIYIFALYAQILIMSIIDILSSQLPK